nr:MAG TPA: YtxC-like family protein [Crassvirales sp.]
MHHIIIKGNNKEYYDSDGNLLKKEPDNNVQSEKEDNIVQIDDFIINNYFK